MSFWQQIQSEMGAAFGWIALAFVFVSLILFVRVRSERLRLRTAFILFLLSLLGFFITAAVAQRSGTQLSLYRWTRWSSILMQRIALVNVAFVFLFEFILEPLRLRPPRIMRELLLALAYVVLFLRLISETGVDISGIVATSAVLTAVIGLSFQDTLVNMMGGMVLQAERAFTTGDWIRVGTHEGVVKEIHWRHTAIETRNWDTVVIPNSILMKSEVVVLGSDS
jgi:small-conductance mechanosensitive channel